MKKKLFRLLAVAAASSLLALVGCNEGGTDPDTPVDPVEWEDSVAEAPAYSVTVAEGEGFIVDAPRQVAEGDGYSFTVGYDENFSSEGAAVTVNGAAVTAEGGSYTVENVQEDQYIAVSGLTRLWWDVYAPDTDGITFKGENKAAAGEAYTFSVSLNAGATKTEDFAVLVNGTELVADGSEYTVAEADSDLVIAVEGVQCPYYTVTLPEGDGYSVSCSQQRVPSGGTLYFTVNLDSTHTRGEGFSVQANGQPLTPQNGIYTVAGVSQNVTITVKGVRALGQYTVTFLNCDGIAPVTVAEWSTLEEPASPSLSGHIFSEWRTEDGQRYNFARAVRGDLRLVAKWLTAEGEDYLALLGEITEDIGALDLSGGIGDAEYELYQSYKTYSSYLTEYEAQSFTETEQVKQLASLAEGYHLTVLGDIQNHLTATWDNGGTQTAFTNGNALSFGVSNAPFDGYQYSIQRPSATDPNVCLDYLFTFEAFDFKSYCESDDYGAVSIRFAFNYNTTSMKCGDVVLIDAAVDKQIYTLFVQDGELFVNGVWKMTLPADVYGGTAPLVLSVHRAADSLYAQVQVSNIGAGARNDAYAKP